jgi:hypothetical protein
MAHLSLSLLGPLHNQAGQPAVRRLEEAVALYRGSLLEGFFLKDSPAFEDSSLLVRERLQHQALAALHRLARYHEQRGEVERAQSYAWRQVKLERPQEPLRLPHFSDTLSIRPPTAQRPQTGYPLYPPIPRHQRCPGCHQ